MAWVAIFAAGLLAATHAGSGVLTTVGGSYPLGEVRNLLAPSGRGVLQFKAGWGAIGLSGPDADNPEPGRYLLHIDRAMALSSHQVAAICDTRTDPAGAITQVSCTGVLGPKREPFRLEWRAKRTAAS